MATRRLQPTRNDCAVRVQGSSMRAGIKHIIWRVSFYKFYKSTKSNKYACYGTRNLQALKKIQIMIEYNKVVTSSRADCRFSNSTET